MKYFTGFVIFLVFFLLYVYLYESGADQYLLKVQSIKIFVNDFGAWGPIIVISLMTGAVVMSPIPSAPIAITSGLLYGHTWGTIYVLIGAEIGALIAFSIARLLGYDLVQKRFGDKINFSFLSSTHHLTVAVFISRLIPFISFDIVSYAAGLTKISYLQFASATFLGILPASFLLAHFGGEIGNNDIQQMILTVSLLGLMTMIPLCAAYLKKKLGD